jgi:hypothetical protein
MQFILSDARERRPSSAQVPDAASKREFELFLEKLKRPE